MTGRSRSAPARIASSVSAAGSIGAVGGHRRSRQPVDRGEEERHAEQAGEDAHDPEPERDLLLVPAAQLEVVVERAHPEDAACRR